MILIEHTERKEVADGVKAFGVGIAIEGEHLDDVISMVYAALDEVTELFIKQHPPDCNSCPAYKNCETIRYHLKQVDEEMRTFMASRNINLGN